MLLKTMVILAAVLSLLPMAAAGEAATGLNEQLSRKIDVAVPDHPTVKPTHSRKVLVLGREDTHPPVKAAAKMLELMARKTGAFTATFSDGTGLKPESFLQFDAVIVNNLHGYDPFAGPRKTELQDQLREFVGNGRGLVGIHAATLAWFDWQDYGAMIGAYYVDWPWKGREEVTVKIEDPTHPVNAAFGGKPFTIADEVYQFREPYSRDKLHVLLSLDTARSPKAGTRKDGDYAVSWVKNYGYGGRVFYTVLGHNNETYTRPAVVRHILDGIQFAIGDLTGERVPSAALAALRKNLPRQATARPSARRKLLVYGLPPGGQHEMGMRGLELALEGIGKQTGAWETVLSYDGTMLTPEKLAPFDALVLNNCGNGLPGVESLETTEKVLLEHVRGGKGLMAIHTTTVFLNSGKPVANETEKAFREMIGGCFSGHPYATPLTLKVEDPGGPLSAAFGGRTGWKIPFVDELYSFKEPYSRERVRVLLSIDTSGLPKLDPSVARTAARADGDYAIAWIRSYGAGRVFQSALGHGVETYADVQYLRFLADATQFVLGDLKADTKPLPLSATNSPIK
ncbi:MAG: ThuA domain-containing protein [Thermoguttaceae bacterium]|jgi:type 1 glutamine amidotransferase